MTDRPDEEILDDWVQATRQLELTRPYDPGVEAVIDRVHQLWREYQESPARVTTEVGTAEAGA